MVSDIEARIADRIRKLLTILVSAGGTVLLLRVLFRLSQGRQELLDPELGLFILLTVIAISWVRATRRMPRRAVRPDSDASHPKPGSDPHPPGDAGV